MKTTSIKHNKVNWISLRAYISYIFQTFFKRPFGYIISILYILYLVSIFLIVPLAYNVDPLFVWNIGGFNMPIFNLMFIAAASGSLAVCIFKTGREDGSDLVFSSKPLTKLSTILVKTFVYIIIMLSLCIIVLLIVVLIKPIFGVYNELTNPTGIKIETYKSLILSMLFGNLVNFLLFSGIAIFITLFGTQVLTMIITIGTAFLMCLLNFLFPLTVQSTTDVLRDKYNSTILSYSLPTLNQYNTDNYEFKNFAAIQCYTNDEGKSEPFDTYKYWTESKKIAKTDYVNYVDFGKQLSLLFSSFGMEDTNIIEAAKLPIGTNKNYRYDIVSSTKVSDSINQTSKEYPISIYTLVEDRGKTFPKVNLLGGTLNLEGYNWYLWSKLLKMNFSSVSFVSEKLNDRIPSLIREEDLKTLNNKPWMKMNELKTSEEELNYIFNSLYDLILNNFKNESKVSPQGINCFPTSAATTIANEYDLVQGEGAWSKLSLTDKYNITSKIQLALIIKSEQEQIKSIDKYCSDNEIKETFPYSSKTVNNWFVYNNSLSKDTSFYYKQHMSEQLLLKGIYLQHIQTSETDSHILYSKMLVSSMNYAETFSNLYQYKIKPFYSIWGIFGAWTSIALILFSTSIIIYKKIDLK